MQIVVCDNEESLDTYVSQLLIDFVNSNERCTLGFATGSTPLGTYKKIIEAYQNKEVDFKDVYAFNLDEYVGIPKDHPRSFSKFMHDNLFNHINIPLSNIDALNGNAKDMQEECKRYEHAISENPIDIQLLGIGMDGHIAYNEPGSPFDGECHVVDLYEESIISSLDYGFDYIDEVPRQGVTQGIGTIMKSRQLIMMAKGAKKAKLVERMLYGEVSENFPSSIIQKHANVIVVLDKEAAKYVKERRRYEKRT